ncbi:VirC2 family conjugal transfer protein [Rhizobium sp. VS19-DR104.2]|uniref:VirC2 family conjugal transfer protein n=1 Tax=unclassified Rhizobium TaxID=2613769 RepID=UPI001C5AEAA5|nr:MULTISPECIES: VirC2 family conjugal transfer protein [unclassified Rhizobium]MBZ5763503.1 VirC2 family conjugal transfer protein [Rhizobium sp. VS19-DR96]MBZ5769445.1 VirC2 family conjugal transfer protein [Rhizobium sp. VS19-DR129.2]MBZ5776978.1 VirC2 family conjugal transfer protein [Rhizobium sp. VS19-DRK62.2]MBZ5788046.1 VirC2 family conjugal transfer protein [Rhizobium sp. VS19-DR121]MBZ5805571.1 VirC2 family conjugal transfer protein [Rhizobium sp. VS19-DR181]
MGIRKPVLSPSEARRLAASRIIDGDPGKAILPVVSFVNNTDADHRGNTLQGTTSQKTLRTRSPKRLASTNSAADFGGGGKIQIFLSAFVPAQGVSPIFDRLRQQYSMKKSLQMIMRRALRDYEGLLANGSFRVTAKSYPVLGNEVEQSVLVCTSHMVPIPLVRVARTYFDPLGLETGRSFGRKLATAALAHFFSQERRTDH